VGDRVGALAVGDAAGELVGDVDQDQDPELAPGVAPTLGQLASNAGESTRHRTANCNSPVNGREDGD
jgi:hypothetical protein